MLGFNGLGCRKLPCRGVLSTVHDLEFSRSKTSIKIAAHLGISDFAHATAQTIADQGTFIDNGLALEVFVAGKGERFPHAVNGVGGLLLVLKPFVRGADDSLSLVPEVSGELAMRRHDFVLRMNLLLVPR